MLLLLLLLLLCATKTPLLLLLLLLLLLSLLLLLLMRRDPEPNGLRPMVKAAAVLLSVGERRASAATTAEAVRRPRLDVVDVISVGRSLVPRMTVCIPHECAAWKEESEDTKISR